jgi:3-oxoacyl-[acyl-carrier protein] reductase
MILFGRLGTREDAGSGVRLFCIPESSYIIGQMITVGGGIRF